MTEDEEAWGWSREAMFRLSEEQYKIITAEIEHRRNLIKVRHHFFNCDIYNNEGKQKFWYRSEDGQQLSEESNG